MAVQVLAWERLRYLSDADILNCVNTACEHSHLTQPILLDLNPGHHWSLGADRTLAINQQEIPNENETHIEAVPETQAGLA